MTVRQLTGVVAGQVLMWPDGAALIYGVDPEVLRIVFPFAPGEDPDPVNAPTEWRQAGARRWREATAATGSNDLLAVLTHWAAHDYDAAVTVDDDGCAYLTGWSERLVRGERGTADTPSSGT
jgi:hypothetical protein